MSGTPREPQVLGMYNGLQIMFSTMLLRQRVHMYEVDGLLSLINPPLENVLSMYFMQTRQVASRQRSVCSQISSRLHACPSIC